MSDLVAFSKRVKEQLAHASREPHWQPDEANRYMADVAERRRRFEEIAVRLSNTVIQPRLEILAGYFPNASLSRDEPSGCCACWFGYCERFPASTKVSFAIEHDIRFDKVVVRFDASMMPMFIKLNEHDRLTLPTGDMSDARVEDWVEERLGEFLDAYLRIDRGGDDFEEEAVTDPVCGMRISRSSAVGSDPYRGHPYYFCSTDCREKFARDPTAFVKVKTM